MIDCTEVVRRSRLRRTLRALTVGACRSRSRRQSRPARTCPPARTTSTLSRLYDPASMFAFRPLLTHVNLTVRRDAVPNSQDCSRSRDLCRSRVSSVNFIIPRPPSDGLLQSPASGCLSGCDITRLHECHIIDHGLRFLSVKVTGICCISSVLFGNFCLASELRNVSRRFSLTSCL